MSEATSSHAYGIGVIALIVGMSATMVFYTSFYLPESLLRPSVSEHILHPTGELVIDIVDGAATEGNDNYVPLEAVAVLGESNRVVWTNSDFTAHTVTPDHRHSDSYSGPFGSEGVVMPGDAYEFLFTEEQVVQYHCIPHPWMQAEITVERARF